MTLTAAKTIVLVSCALVCAGATTLTWVSSTSNSTGAGSNTDLSGAMSFAANGGYVLNESSTGHVRTASGSALKLQSTTTNVVGGHLSYIKID